MVSIILSRYDFVRNVRHACPVRRGVFHSVDNRRAEEPIAGVLPLDTLDTLDILNMSSLSSTGLLGSGPWTSWTGHLSL